MMEDSLDQPTKELLYVKYSLIGFPKYPLYAVV